MKIIRLFTATIIAAMVFGTVEAGRNVGATVEIDWDATTPRIESKCGSGDEIALAVQVNGSADLTGYFVSLEYDTSKVRMIGVLNHLPGKSAFIESCGGKAGPLMVVPNDRGSVRLLLVLSGPMRHRLPMAVEYLFTPDFQENSGVKTVR